MQPVNAEPPNLREDMCGTHRKRRATEDEDEALGANENPDSPYAVFLASLRPKAKGAALGPEISLGAPVVVYTGPARKPGDPPPVVVDIKPKKPKPAADAKAKEGVKDPAKAKESVKNVAAKPETAKPDATKPAATKPVAATPVAAKPTTGKDKETAPKAARTDTTTTATTTPAKPKKPAPKTSDTAAPGSPQTTQAR